MNTITAEELKNKLDSGEDFKLVNVLSKESFEAKHIPGSINIPGGEIEEKSPQILQDKNEEIIVYCSSQDCKASPTAGKKLEEMGYTNVSHFPGGLAGWLEAGYDLEGTAV